MTLILPHDLVGPASNGTNAAELCFWTPDRFRPLPQIDLRSKPGVPARWPQPREIPGGENVWKGDPPKHGV